MKRLSIGILGTRGIPNHYGGFEQFAQYLSLGLHERGHDVYVYNSSRHPYQEEEWNGVHIIPRKDPEHIIGTAGQFLYDLNCINDSRKRNFDILLHLGYTSDSIWHWRWPRKTIHLMNVDGMEWKRSKYNKASRRFLRWAEALAARHSQVLIADSPRMQEYFSTTYGKRPEFIPYGTEPFTAVDAGVPGKHRLTPSKYFLLVARMEPENNIEMIVRGYLAAQHEFPLLVLGNTGNKFGSYLVNAYRHPSVLFAGSVYDQVELNNLRYYSARYFHGHSVGGTNPSLLEAMACGCSIAAHDNVFNKSVLQEDADYFSTAEHIATLINRPPDAVLDQHRRLINMEKTRSVYSREKNIDDYERLMLGLCRDKAPVFR